MFSIIMYYHNNMKNTFLGVVKMKRIILIMSLILFSFNTFALSQQEKNDLIFMYQEEKLAHDVYTQFYKIYNIKYLVILQNQN